MDTRKEKYKIYDNFKLKHIPELQRLHQDIWGETPLTAAYWQWKYIDNPLGVRILFQKNAEGRLISFFAFMEQEIEIAEESFKVLVGYDVMSHPELGGGRYFLKLLGYIKKEIFPNYLLVGFSNENAEKIYSVFVRKQEPFISRIPVISCPLNTAMFRRMPSSLKRVTSGVLNYYYRFMVGVSSFGNLDIEIVDSFDDEFDSLWARVKADKKIVFKRDKKILNWRYLNDPSREFQIFKASEEGKLVGYMITTVIERAGRKVCLLFDWLVQPQRPEVFRQLLATVVKKMLDDGVTQIDSWWTKNDSSINKIFSSFLFVKHKERKLFVAGGPLWFDKRYQEHQKRLTSINNYFFTYGDTDFIGMTSSMPGQ